MTEQQAMRMALEALELVSIEFVCNGAHHAKKDRHEWLDPCPIVDRYKKAITALRQALEQQPSVVSIDTLQERVENSKQNRHEQQPADEPVGLIESLKDAKPCCGQYETCWRACTPRGKFLGQRDAMRERVGLTDEDLCQLASEYLHYQIESYEVSGIYNFARAIEAKLKEKNSHD